MKTALTALEGPMDQDLALSILGSPSVSGKGQRVILVSINNR